MALLKDTIKRNIMTAESKYKYDGEKVGRVIEVNEAEKCCTIFIITRDGVSSIEYNVPVTEGKTPKMGDLVKVKEQFKKFSIIGIYDRTNFDTTLEGDVYSCIYGAAINGYVGY
jgi:hypothetical protein